MNLKKDETNNCICTKLCSVRKHPNADRLKLATVLGCQVIVGLDSKDGDLVLYFDSNLRLSHDYLHYNNLYSSAELNADTTQKGYFGKNGRVRAQKFRGEVSNGYVAELDSLVFTFSESDSSCLGDCCFENSLAEGDEFTHLNGIEICSKYVIANKHVQGQPRPVASVMFHRHWDTKQLMRELESIPEDAICYIEEKIHGTSGRVGNVLCKVKRGWKFWKPKEEWKIVGGTRRVDNTEFHLPAIRKEIEGKVAPHLYKGEQIYFEIYGYDGGKEIQPGFHYDCRGGEFKAMLYRVTLTTVDGYYIDLDREQVYQRAEELGLEKPYLIGTCRKDKVDHGHNMKRSLLDVNTLFEGIVVWFKDKNNRWTCLKHKSEEFLVTQDKLMEKEVTDVEDSL